MKLGEAPYIGIGGPVGDSSESRYSSGAGYCGILKFDFVRRSEKLPDAELTDGTMR